MRVPVAWLKELVDVDATTAQIAERLALSGTGVESIERIGQNVAGIVVGRVLEVADVAESSKLCVAQVDVGGTDAYQIVAGAKNFTVGDMVPVALPGARVTTLDVPIGIRTMAKKYESHGMLCSAHELGVAEDHGGILVLDPTAPLGADVVDLLGLSDDVLELEITANRPDLLSVYGVAREVAVLFDTALGADLPGLEANGAPISELTSVEVLDSQACPRYLAMVVSDVQWGPSPLAVQVRLTACGMRPIGNLVDATNYVLQLTGQPLHAFDLDRLDGNRIVVRRATAGEKISTLDGEVRELIESDLVIADASRAQAIAGVMGGTDSEVGPSTSRVLLESAWFDPTTIARTSKRLGLMTEASRRFERGADPGATVGAAAVCAELMRRWASGAVSTGDIDTGQTPERQKIELRRDRVNQIMGVDVADVVVERVLSGLGCEVHGHSHKVDVRAPTWRPDLTREIDLIEEVARIHGYDKIPLRLPTGGQGGLTTPQIVRRQISDVLTGAGLSEAVLNSFVARADLDHVSHAQPTLRVINPLSGAQEDLRPSLVINLLRCVSRNQARGSRDAALFEIGNIFGTWSDATTALPEQHLHLGLVLAGNSEAQTWHAADRGVDSFDMKGVLETLLETVGVQSFELGEFDAMPLHPGRSASLILNGRTVGYFGTVRPSVARAFDIETDVVVAELEIAALVEASPQILHTTEIPRQPAVRRDVTFLVAEHIAAGDLEETITAAAGESLEDLQLRDIYRGEQVPDGHKALTYRLVLRAGDRTLTDADADAVRDSVVEATIASHRATVR